MTTRGASSDVTTSPLFSIVDSPIGPLTLVGKAGSLRGLYMADQRHAPEDRGASRRDDGAFDDVRAQLDAYFQGELLSFDVGLAMDGTPFRQRVWADLQGIPYGEVVSYGALAARIGSPAAARAVGLANGRNPVSIIVPCHRVIGASGALTGYGGGLERKQWLLDHERAVLARRAG